MTNREVVSAWVGGRACARVGVIVAHLAAKKAYEQSGVAPEDVDVAEVHDATAMGEFLNAEALMRSLFVQARRMVPRAH